MRCIIFFIFITLRVSHTTHTGHNNNNFPVCVTGCRHVSIFQVEGLIEMFMLFFYNKLAGLLMCREIVFRNPYIGSCTATHQSHEQHLLFFMCV